MVNDKRAIPIPLATVGGFLGSGKTTLINHLLSQANGRRYVVFVNDFGAINIDLQLVETIEDDRISFSNGCVCCTLNDEFVGSVAEMSKRQDRPDAILIEASGVADPRALEASLKALEAANHVRLETALYIVDAACFGQRDYAEVEMLIDHAATSDLVLLNKSDLVTKDALDALLQEFSVAAPYAATLATVQSRVSPALLFGNSDRPTRPEPKAGPHRHPDYHHWHYSGRDPMTRDALLELTKILQQHFFRIKGIIQSAEDPTIWLSLQVVGTRAVIGQLPRGFTGKDAVEIVGIGIGPEMRGNELDRSLAAFEKTLKPTPA